MTKFWNWTNKKVLNKETNTETTERVLTLNGIIAEESWFDDDVTPKLFRDELESGSGNITVWINSPGGDCVAAAQIYNMLKDYKGNVTVKIDGIAASAASVIAMAGEEVYVSPVSMLMIHNPATSAFGNTADMQKAIEMLDEVKNSILNAYQLKTGLTRAKLSRLMDNETWMDANKAVELGFADDILFRNKDNKPDDEPDEDEENTPSPDEDEENPLKNPKKASMLFSCREVNSNFVNKVQKHFQHENKDPQPTEAVERSVDALMERLNLIKKYI